MNNSNQQLFEILESENVFTFKIPDN